MLLCVVFTPLILQQEIALENRLNDKVVFIIARFQQTFLHDGQFTLVNAQQT